MPAPSAVASAPAPTSAAVRMAARRAPGKPEEQEQHLCVRSVAACGVEGRGDIVADELTAAREPGFQVVRGRHNGLVRQEPGCASGRRAPRDMDLVRSDRPCRRWRHQ